MKKAIAGIRNSLLILAGGIVVGVLLLVFAFMLPVKEEKAQETYTLIGSEGDYPSVQMGMSGWYFWSYFPDVLDNVTDKLILYTALDDSSEGSLLERAFNMYNAYQDRNYSYYWHGYVSVLRPLLYLFNYGELRIGNGALQMFLCILLAHQMKKKTGWGQVLLLFTGYVLLSPVALSMSLQFSWVFYIGVLTAFVLLCRQEYLEQESRYLYVFLVTGMLTSYFDLLTYPLFTWGFPVFCLILCSKTTQGKLLKRTVLSGIAWLTGYVAMWMAKWGLANWILHRNVYEMAIEEVKFRSAVDDAAVSGLSYRLEAIYVNWKYYGFTVYFIILMIWLLWALWQYLLKGFKRTDRCAALLLTGFSGICWYFVAANHVQIHRFFTYRIFNVSVLAVLAVFLECVPQNTRTKQQDWKKVLARGFKLAGIVAVACGMVLFAREDFEADNYFAESRTLPIAAGESLWVEFTPRASHIKQFDFNVITQEIPEKGTFCVRIWDEENLRYQETFDAVTCIDWKGSAQEVDWRLKKGKTYHMEIFPEDIGQEVSAILIVPQEAKLPDVGMAFLDGEPVEGQFACNMVYRMLPTSNRTLVFLAATWVGVVMSIVLGAGSCLTLKRN